MKIEQQVCSLELAKKLKKLEVKQESVWYWSRIATGNGKKGQITKAKLLPDWEIQPELTERDGVYRYSAFTVAELGEMLKVYESDVSPFPDWNSEYKAWDNGINDYVEKTEANARAKMLIYLLEKKII